MSRSHDEKEKLTHLGTMGQVKGERNRGWQIIKTETTELLQDLWEIEGNDADDVDDHIFIL